jgi:hypothetical protein
MANETPETPDGQTLRDARELKAMRDADSLDRRMVAGDRMRLTLQEFKHRCSVRLQEEQAKPLPDNANIDLWCEAVRCARELEVALAGLNEAWW